jgi:hypothetical protein
MFRLDLALQDVNIEKLGHALACRVVARRVDVARVKRVRLRQGYGATAFALFYDASEDWRQGDSNP